MQGNTYPKVQQTKTTPDLTIPQGAGQDAKATSAHRVGDPPDNTTIPPSTKPEGINQLANVEP